MYPSGTWRGYWEQEGYGRQAMQDFTLRFADGRITGGGHDIVGLFTFAGTYDNQGNVVLEKKYIERHTVHYEGTYDGEGTISGGWSISPSWEGPFAMTADGVRSSESWPVLELRPKGK